MSVTSKGRRWEILHSWWIGWTFTLGVLSWVAFLYIGLRVEQRKWILWTIFYSVPVIGLAVLAGLGASTYLGAPVMLLIPLLGIVSILHAFRVRKEYLMRLEALKREKSRKEEALRQQIVPDTNQEEPAKDQTADTVKTSVKTSPSHAPGGETRFSSKLNQPLPSKRDTLIPYEKLLEVCTKYISNGYYVDPAVPPKISSHADLLDVLHDVRKVF